MGRRPFFTSVAFNPSDRFEAWVTVGQLGNGVGQVYHTTTAGALGGNKWTDVTGTDASTALPAAPALSVVQEPGKSTIDVGTYYGVWQCTTCAKGSTNPPDWKRLGTNLPVNVEVDRLTVSQDNKNLMAWTHGRGIWTVPLS